MAKRLAIGGCSAGGGGVDLCPLPCENSGRSPVTAAARVPQIATIHPPTAYDAHRMRCMEKHGGPGPMGFLLSSHLPSLYSRAGPACADIPATHVPRVEQAAAHPYDCLCWAIWNVTFVFGSFLTARRASDKYGSCSHGGLPISGARCAGPWTNVLREIDLSGRGRRPVSSAHAMKRACGESSAYSAAADNPPILRRGVSERC